MSLLSHVLASLCFYISSKAMHSYIPNPCGTPNVFFASFFQVVSPSDIISKRKSKEDSSTRWSDGLSGDPFGLFDAQFEFIQRRANTKPSAPDDPTPWTRWSVGLSDGRVKANRGDLSAESSAPDDPTHRRCIASEQLCQRTSTAKWCGRGTGWTDALENIASDHPTVPFSVDFNQRLVWCLGLFIPPPLTHLRLLDCVEVQRSSRHIEDNTQSIQVLNCSSLDLHMLCVCA
jgi:hypothetical protein